MESKKTKRPLRINARRREKKAGERPVPARIYPVLDTDLARDNVENDLPAADLEDLE